jgi:hypothetical protein
MLIMMLLNIIHLLSYMLFAYNFIPHLLYSVNESYVEVIIILYVFICVSSC